MSRRRRSSLDMPEVGNKHVEKAKKKAAIKFADMFVPNVTWEFYESFAKCPQSQAAFRNETISITHTHLDKYLGLARKEILAANRKQFPPDPIPEYLRKLISIQDLSGKFCNMAEVLKCFEMPEDLTLKRNPALYQEWERATSLAIAGFRQHIEIFEYIRESHDKAVLWLRSNELVYEARELLHEFAFSKPVAKKLPPWLQPAAINQPISQPVTQTQSQQLIEPPLSISIPIIEQTSTVDTKNNENEVFDCEIITSPINPDEYIAAELVSSRQNSPPGSAGFTNLDSKLAYLRSEVDADKLETQRIKVEQSEQLVIRLFEHIEMLVKEISLCLIRCVSAYNNCELFADRYSTFDELTARLGEGSSGSLAYTDWRRNKIPGLRPAIFDFCSAVQQMADDRLAYQEIAQPLGRDWSVRINQTYNKNRWIITFHNENLVLKVLHYLDFLRKSRELNNWYGPGYYFVANPLSLPFPLHVALGEFKLKRTVEDYLNSIPHEKHGFCDVKQRQSSWTYQHKLNEFRRQFTELSAETYSFNWPVLPSVREEKVCEQLFTSLCVFFICCESSIANSYQWEKRFITAISSLRGQSTYLIGEANLRENKPLILPNEEERKPRMAMIKKIFEARNGARPRSSANSATLPPAAMATRNKSVSFMALIEEQDDDSSTNNERKKQEAELPKVIPTRSAQPRRETLVAKAKQSSSMMLAASNDKRAATARAQIASTAAADIVTNDVSYKAPPSKLMMRKSSTSPSNPLLRQQQQLKPKGETGDKEEELSLAESCSIHDKEQSDVHLPSTMSSSQQGNAETDNNNYVSASNLRLENARIAAITKLVQRKVTQSKFVTSRRKLGAGPLVLPSIKAKEVIEATKDADEDDGILQLAPAIEKNAEVVVNEKKGKSPPHSSKGKRKSTITIATTIANDNNPENMLVEQQQLQSLSRADLFKESMQSKRVSRILPSPSRSSHGSDKQQQMQQLSPLGTGGVADVSSQSLSTISDGLESKKRTTQQKKMTKRSSVAVPLPASVSVGGSISGENNVSSRK